MTNLVRFSPGTELQRMQREFDRVFNSFFPSRLEENGDGEAAVWSPRVDLSETEDGYRIVLDVPGMAKDQFNISYQEGLLTVSGERKFEEEQEGRNYVRMERTYGHFFRSFRLPKAIKEDAVSATYQDGVLTIVVPKAEESRPRRIEVS